MAKRLLTQPLGGHLIASPGLKEAPVLDLMCSHFVLTLAARQGAKPSMCAATSTALCPWPGRHLVWPLPVLARLREVPGAALRQQRTTGAVTRRSKRCEFLPATAPGAAPTKKAHCSSTWTNTPRTSPRT
jgi:hypothetical protein